MIGMEDAQANIPRIIRRFPVGALLAAPGIEAQSAS
jgi:hypothetical protein